MESKIGSAALQSSHHREQAKAHGCLSTYTLEYLCFEPTTEPTTESTTEPNDRPTSPSAALPQRPCGRVIGEEDHGGAAAASPPRPITPPLSQQSPGQEGSALDKEEDHDDEWKILRIIGKRRTSKGNEYRVRWKSTWKPETELGNAQRLVQEFKARLAKHRGKRSRPAGI